MSGDGGMYLFFFYPVSLYGDRTQPGGVGGSETGSRHYLQVESTA